MEKRNSVMNAKRKPAVFFLLSSIMCLVLNQMKANQTMQKSSHHLYLTQMQSLTCFQLYDYKKETTGRTCDGFTHFCGIDEMLKS